MIVVTKFQNRPVTVRRSSSVFSTAEPFFMIIRGITALSDHSGKSPGGGGKHIFSLASVPTSGRRPAFPLTSVHTPSRWPAFLLALVHTLGRRTAVPLAAVHTPGRRSVSAGS